MLQSRRSKTCQPDGEEEYFDIEYFIARVGTGKNCKYWVKWEGFDKPTLEPQQLLICNVNKWCVKRTSRCQ